MEKTEFYKKAEVIYQEALDTLKQIVSINTIYDETSVTSKTPFGQGVENGLEFLANLAKQMGFNVDRCDNYVDEFTCGDLSSNNIIDIYAHCDVVPVSKNWKTDPFYPTIKDGIMYARGSSDDKGPLVASLYALKILKDQYDISNCKIRFIVGGDEERNSACLEHYFHKLNKPYPRYGFSPDADYPLIYAEKGIFSYKASYKIDLPGISSFKFGRALNVVLDEVNLDVSNLKLDDIINKYSQKYPEVQIKCENNILSIKGKPSHGSLPWQGVNAGLHLLNLLSGYYQNNLLNKIFEDYRFGDGKNFHGNYSSNHFADSSYCVGKIEYSNSILTIYVNMRLPENVLTLDAIKNVKENTSCDKVELLSSSEGFIIDPNSDFVKVLLKAYQDETGDYNSKVLAIGGGTYSRESKNTVAFGMQFPGIDTLMHQDGEYLRLDDFKKSIAIYLNALYNLVKLVNN